MAPPGIPPATIDLLAVIAAQQVQSVALLVNCPCAACGIRTRAEIAANINAPAQYVSRISGQNLVERLTKILEIKARNVSSSVNKNLP